MAQGLFVGLTTLDVIYHVAALPQPNQKMVAQDAAIAAGGPATNAAVAFQHLGQGQHCTRLLSSVGQHSLAQVIRADLHCQSLILYDLEADRTSSPPLSSILVTPSTGDRAVVSLNAVKSQVPPDRIPAELWDMIQQRQIEIVLMDGHQMQVSEAIARQCQQQRIPVVVDGGSWKPGFERLLPWASYVICSANFYPPHCQTSSEVIHYLHKLGVPSAAVTRGGDSILWSDRPQSISSLPVPTVQPLDTLGAGDIFHGAFCHFILGQSFREAMESAAAIAALACQYMGTRQWLLAERP